MIDVTEEDETEEKRRVAREIALANIRTMLEANRRERDRLLGMLDEFRVQCPSCRCRLLPGDACACCADIGWTTSGKPVVRKT